MKKILVLGLALALILSLALVSFASTSVSNIYLTYDEGGETATIDAVGGFVTFPSATAPVTLHVPFTALSNVSGSVSIAFSFSIDATSNSAINSVIPFSSYASLPFYDSEGTLLFNGSVTQSYVYNDSTYSKTEFETVLDEAMPSSVDYVQVFTFSDLSSHSSDFADIAELRLLDSNNAADDLVLSVSYDLTVSSGSSSGLSGVWSGLTSAVTGIFSAVSATLTSILGANLITLFVIVMPLTGIAIALLFRFLRRRRT